MLGFLTCFVYVWDAIENLFRQWTAFLHTCQPFIPIMFISYGLPRLWIILHRAQLANIFTHTLEGWYAQIEVSNMFVESSCCWTKVIVRQIIKFLDWIELSKIDSGGHQRCQQIVSGHCFRTPLWVCAVLILSNIVFVAPRSRSRDNRIKRSRWPRQTNEQSKKPTDRPPPPKKINAPNNLRDTLAQKDPRESKFGAKIDPENFKYQGIHPEKPERQGSQGRTVSRVKSD